MIKAKEDFISIPAEELSIFMKDVACGEIDCEAAGILTPTPPSEIVVGTEADIIMFLIKEAGLTISYVKQEETYLLKKD